MDDIRDLAYRGLGALSRNAAFRTFHRAAYQATDGRWIVGRSLGVETILLTVTGRRSGQRRTVPLYAFAADAVAAAGSWAVVATNGGAEAAPGWSLDLATTPTAIVRHRDVSFRVVARPASEAETAALWPVIVGAYPGYEGYRRRRSAGAPIILLSPVSGS